MSDPDQLEQGRFLTDKQRDYLQGRHEPPTDNAEYQMRSKIRNRTKGAIHDLTIASRNLSQKDRSLLLEIEKPDSLDEMVDWNGQRLAISQDENATGSLWGGAGFATEMMSIIEFYYKSLREIGYSKEDLCSIFEYTIESGESEYGPGYRNVDATVKIERVEDVDLESAKQRLEQGGIEAVSFAEIKALSEHDEIEIHSNE